MSPTEKELRAALRRGEGEVPDPAELMAHARGVQRQRRARIMSAAAAVVIVGGVAGGATWLGQERSNPSAVAGPDHRMGTELSPNLGGPMTPIQHAPPRSTTPASPGPHALGSPAAGCSARPVQYLLPGGGSNQFGGAGALVGKPVRAVLVCAYVPAAGGQQVYSRAVSFTGPAATELADSLNRPDSENAEQPCVLFRPGTLVLHPVATDGSRLTPVTITMLSCSFRATNGTALRTNWLPPAGLYSTLLQPLSGVSVAPPGRPVRASGSPVH